MWETMVRVRFSVGVRVRVRVRVRVTGNLVQALNRFQPDGFIAARQAGGGDHAIHAQRHDTTNLVDIASTGINGIVQNDGPSPLLMLRCIFSRARTCRFGFGLEG
jgi:hypothetical protein